ncbi:glycosyltransferase family A protein [Flavobacterium sp.]|uniref:glycosyltransferase family A protein n=1 Tax=Flavobacterium sp. TaxID=239 RepID=UPI003B995C96
MKHIKPFIGIENQKESDSVPFSLIVCTYMRSKALKTLLQSVEKQTRLPTEILIIDGSTNTETTEMINNFPLKTRYFLVDQNNRGLTKQRNFGIERVAANSEIVCFLDDDTVLAPTYFEAILNTYAQYPEALGVGGFITNEISCWPAENKSYSKTNYFEYGGYVRLESLRFKARKWLGLDSNLPPGFMPEYGHGRSISFLPPDGKIYEVNFFMGGVASYRKEIFKKLQFSQYFEGYGLYEDAHFCLQLSNLGKLFVNTAAQLEHHHDVQGRPNQYKYGKMVVRNGWFVWRTKYPHPSFKNKFKWHVITLLLMYIRFTNVLNTKQRKAAFTEFLGRKISWINVLLGNKPKLE